MPRRFQAPVRLAGGVACAVLLCAGSSSAQPLPPWAITVEGGASDVHGVTAVDGPAGAIRLSRRIPGYDWIRAEIAVTGGSADKDRGFGTAEVGVELRYCSSCRITGFIGGGGGYMKETRWEGGLLRANAGLELRVSRDLSARAMAQIGGHDGVRGPHLAMMGVVWRFGGHDTGGTLAGSGSEAGQRR